MSFVVRTPFGCPVSWAEVGFGGCGEDGSPGGNQYGRLIVSGWRLGRRPGLAAGAPFEQFLLCLLAEGAAWRDCRVALAAFVGSFLGGDEVDVLWRLRAAITAADLRLATRCGGTLGSTLTAVFVGGDGTAYGVAVGDSPLLVGLPEREQLDNPMTKVLGHEPGATLGTGETLAAGATATGYGVVEAWWPDLGGDGTRTRLVSGTSLVLARRDNTPGLAVRFAGRRAASQRGLATGFDGLRAASQRGLAEGFAGRRAASQRGLAMHFDGWRAASQRGLAMGFDGWRAASQHGLAVRFDGPRAATPGLLAQRGWLVSVGGGFGQSAADTDRSVGLACLCDDDGGEILAALVDRALESGVCCRDGLERCFQAAGGDLSRTRLVAVTARPGGDVASFGSAGASSESVALSGADDRPGSTGLGFVLRLGTGSDPLDRGVPIAFEHGAGATSLWRAPAHGRGRVGVGTTVRRWLHRFAAQATLGR